MSFIENIKTNNQFPIIFIGSGITQRYFKNAPKWEELLIKLWTMIYEEESFYSKFNKLHSEGKNDFEIYLSIASFLELKINQAFYDKTIKLPNLTAKKAHMERISPFRQIIANIFSSLERKEGIEEEMKFFAGMLVKARFIITTNYDTFIEECFDRRNTGITVNVGNTGLFTKSTNYGELYKIHGSVKDPNTICVTQEDYKENESNLSIVNAKILSNLTESPILFLGYSLTDKNIRELLASYAKNLSLEIEEAASRIGIVEYVDGKEEVEEIESNISDLKMYYTKISTDNYTEIYKAVSEIEQGYLPSEISKYEGLFRKIIEIKGRENKLQSVLANFVDLSRIDKEVKSKNIVIAFGDEKYIYKIPTYVDYIKNYFNSKNEMPLEIALEFLTHQTMRTDIPFNKYLDRVTELIETSKKRKYVVKLSNWKEKYDKVGLDKIIEISKNKLGKSHLSVLNGANTPNEIYDTEGIPEEIKVYYIISKIKDIDFVELKEFINKLLKTKSDSSLNKTAYRKLFMSYSLLSE